MASDSDDPRHSDPAVAGPRSGRDRDDHDPDGHRPRRSPLTVALVAGAVLVAGGGGAYWAAAADHAPGGAASSTAPPKLALSGWTGSGAGGGGGGPVQVTGSLPSGPGTAAVYVPAGSVARDQVARLAAALRVTGDPVSGGGVWKAGPGDGGPGPTLQVGQDAPGSWTYVRTGGGAACKPPAGTGAGKAGGTVCYGAAGAPASGTARGGTASGGSAVSAAAAQKAAAPVLAALGLRGAAVDASRTAGGVREVTADPVVGGLPTSGWRTTFQVGPDGRLLSASGRLAPLAAGARYPVVSAQSAVGELRHAGTGTRLCGGGVMHPGAAGAGTTNAGTTGGPASPAPGARQNLPCLAAAPALKVSGAVFGLSAQIVSGRAELVPSWLLTVDGTAATATPGTLAQPAVDPAYLTAPASSGAPVPPSSAPGGGPVSPAMRVASYTVAGRTVTLRFWGGVCSDYTARVVSQSAADVRVRITAAPKHPVKPCPMLAKSVTAKVTLAQPLGHRTLHDVSNGDRVPAARH
ncbi:hypothetical protein POF50_012640 [Streptomyces sp. SL13]|uniref:Large membrane protein n=1 Tax=Streptantibioticus silvisoli TaxID=2705255 RepID=A0AA90H382_9ACTN|nr:hypothetical protein [Streptantibioticus silvisoli]MDI5970178.1 hypothetical protein [Streptantibioticus silvisoli]